MATYFKGLTVEQALLVFNYTANQTDTILYTAPSNERAIIRLSIAKCSIIYCGITFRHFDGQFGVLKRSKTISAQQALPNKIIGKDNNGQDQYYITSASNDPYSTVINELTFELQPLDQLKANISILTGGNVIDLAISIEKFRAA